MGRLELGAGKVIDAPWITEDGCFDPTKYPLDGVLAQTLSNDEGEFRSGCRLLQSMASQGRTEAGVCLLGLAHCYAENLERLSIIAECLGHFNCRASTELLLAELRRVKSSNSTRCYIKRVLEAVSHFPYEMVGEGLERLADDSSFSYKMRQKFRGLADELRFHHRKDNSTSA